MTIGRMRLACWVTNSIHTHSEYVIIIAFPRQIGNANAPEYYAHMYNTSFVYFIYFAVVPKVFEICHIFRAFLDSIYCNFFSIFYYLYLKMYLDFLRFTHQTKAVRTADKLSVFILIIFQGDATQSSLVIILQVHSTCFRC